LESFGLSVLILGVGGLVYFLLQRGQEPTYTLSQIRELKAVLAEGTATLADPTVATADRVPPVAETVAVAPLNSTRPSVFPMAFEVQSASLIENVRVTSAVDFYEDTSRNVSWNTSRSEPLKAVIAQIEPPSRAYGYIEGPSSGFRFGVKSAQVSTVTEFSVPDVAGRWKVSQTFKLTRGDGSNARWSVANISRAVASVK
jgi:hypothetical protein